MPVFSPVEKLWIARMALGFFTCLVATIVWSCSLRHSRRQYDPARFAFLLLRVFMGFFILACLLDALTFLLVLLQTTFGLFSVPDSSNSLGCLGLFFMMLTESLIFVMLIHLLNGVSISQLGSLSNTGKALNPLSTTIAVLMGILAIATLALGIMRVFGFFELNHYLWVVSLSFRALDLVASIIIVARSIRVKAISREGGRIAKTSTLAVVCCGLALTRSIYGLASEAATESRFWIYLHILHYVFEVWPNLVIFCITFVTSMDRQDGIWSLHQPPPQPITIEPQQPAWNTYPNVPQQQPTLYYDPQTGETWQAPSGYNQPQEQYRYYPQQSLAQGMYTPELYSAPPELAPTELQPPTHFSRPQRSPSPILLPNTPASYGAIRGTQSNPIPGFARR